MASGNAITNANSPRTGLIGIPAVQKQAAPSHSGEADSRQTSCQNRYRRHYISLIWEMGAWIFALWKTKHTRPPPSLSEHRGGQAHT